MVFQRLHGFAILGFRTAADSHHHRLRRTVDIGVENPDLRTFGRQRQGQVDSGSRFADAALAGRHRNDVLDVRHQLDAALHCVRLYF